MAGLFPFRSDVDVDADESRFVRIDDDAADEVFDALSSRTARSILAATYEDPRPASELADAADTSLQNARYHLDGLSEAGLVRVADTWYSERGTEMKVYAPSNDSVVVVASDDETTAGAFDALKRLLGAVGAVSVGALVLQALVSPGSLLPSFGSSGAAGGASSAAPSTTAGSGVSVMSVGNASSTTTTTAASRVSTAGGAGGAAHPGGLAGVLAQPGVAFFVGGALVLGALFAWSALR